MGCFSLSLAASTQTRTYSPATFWTVTCFSPSVVSIFFNCATSGSGAPETGVPSEGTRWAASGIAGSDGLGALQHEQRVAAKSNVTGIVRGTTTLLLSNSKGLLNKSIEFIVRMTGALFKRFGENDVHYFFAEIDFRHEGRLYRYSDNRGSDAMTALGH